MGKGIRYTEEFKQEAFIYMTTHTDEWIHWITHFSITSKNPLEDMLE